MPFIRVFVRVGILSFAGNKRGGSTCRHDEKYG